MNSKNPEQNQEVDDELSLSFRGDRKEELVEVELPIITKPSGKAEKNLFLRVIKLPAVEYKVQEVFSINPKTYNELKDRGVVPQKGTYEEILIALFDYYRQKNDVALRKLELNANKTGLVGTRSIRASDTESGLPRVVEAEKIQKIRLDRAREQEVHLKNLSSRKELVNKQELYGLISPLIGNIANILRNAADENPNVQEVVDKCFINLYTVGQKLLEQANKDSEQYVKYMLETPVDLDSIVENAELEL